MATSRERGYKYRIAFGAWMNDMRIEPLPLENWPAPQLDDQTVESIIRAMDVQADAGFNMLDVWGLFATYGWPPDVLSAVDEARAKRIRRLLRAARDRGMKLALGLGVYSWGYDRIIEADPSVRGKTANGTPHAHAMCDGNPKAFEYVRKIIDFVLERFDFGAVHLESFDLGYCECPECAGKEGVVAYGVRINQKVADYIKSKWPDKIVYVITINWAPYGQQFTDEDMERLVELSKHVDCIFDQGHAAYYVPEEKRREFIRRLQCAYGTSAKLWLYPCVRWDRTSYFLPYTKRSGEAIKHEYADGVRGCLFYQGPMINPSTEVNVAVGGRLLSNPHRSINDVLAEVLQAYYKPRTTDALAKLLRVFQLGEESYFGQWAAKGEFHLTPLWDTSPGPATFLREPYLNAAGRKAYKQGLLEILKELPALFGQCDDGGRLKRIERSVIITLQMLNTIQSCLGESQPGRRAAEGQEDRLVVHRHHALQVHG